MAEAEQFTGSDSADGSVITRPIRPRRHAKAPGHNFSKYNILVSPRPWHVFEIQEEWLLSPIFRRTVDAAAGFHWTLQLPFLQQVPPADLAARIVENVLDGVEELYPDSPLAVVDFFSGDGGALPAIEHQTNWRRSRRGRKPAAFSLSDPRPRLDAWIPLSEASAHLAFIPQAATPVVPPVAAVSDRFRTDDGRTSGSKVVRLWCGSFHHHNDAAALQALESALRTADAIAVVEPLDRRAASLLLVCAGFFLHWAVAVFWFTWDPLALALTYPIPLLPLVLAFDGLVRCLRWRTFDEMIALVVAAHAGRPSADSKLGAQGKPWFDVDYGTRHRKLHVGDWYFEGGRTLHTWPFGYLTYFVGRRIKK